MKEIIHNIIQNFIAEDGFTKTEADVQSSYTLKILEALGWDSSKWKISTPQEVKTRKKPDILLRGGGGGTIFIIEHKAPKESLDGSYPNKTFVEQLCEYCTAEGIYWGVLTNFVEWRLYNAYQKALYFNKKYFTIVDGKLNDSEELCDFFETISYNNLNAPTRKGKIDHNPIYYKPKEEIREEFFYNLKKWRALLRAYLYKNYSHFEPLVIEQQTQKILDRLIFAKVCYDKNILSQDILGSVLYSTINKFKEIKQKFRELDDKFNSELFAKDVCDNFEIADELFEAIITGINRVDFSNLSVHIIGEVYEDYLGGLLRESQRDISVVETKEQAKRRSQGIYYTPDYIVDYIVENTLGEILKKCKTEEEVEKVTVLDPACGSGSFLIRTFDEFYNAYKRVKPQWNRFDETAIRKKILLQNIYGVDLDERAVEIARLNLLLKAMDTLSDEALEGRKILPNLSLNIRCGNSLISGNYDEEIALTLFDDKSQFDADFQKLVELKEKFFKAVEDDEKQRIINEVMIYEEKINSYCNQDIARYFKNLDKLKPFNYKVAICEVFRKKDGFDCVIGNPPYVFARGRKFSKSEKKYFYDYYEHQIYQLNTYILFIEKGYKLLNKNGRLGFIVPNNWLSIISLKKFKDFILSSTGKIKIVNLLFKVFGDANVDTSILTFQKGRPRLVELIESSKQKQWKVIDKVNYRELIGKGTIRFKIHKNEQEKNIFNKIVVNSLPLKDICRVSTGLKAYQIGKGKPKQSRYEKEHRVFHSNKKLSLAYLKYLDGKDVQRYKLEWSGEYLKYGDFLAEPRKSIPFKGPRILVRQIPSSPPYCINAVYTKEEYLHDINSMVIFNCKKNYSLKYILALINSKLLSYWFDREFEKFQRKIFPQFKVKELSLFPIVPISNISKEQQKKLIHLVNQMLVLQKEPEKNKIKIQAKNLEIDDLVYEIYGISSEEKDIINKWAERHLSEK